MSFGAVAGRRTAAHHRSHGTRNSNTLIRVVVSAGLQRMLRGVVDSSGRMSAKVDRSFTLRQRQIVQLIAAGLFNEEIGATLGISERTVRAHCEALRLKL